MPTFTTKRVGAGGFWNVIDEVFDVDVEKQSTQFSCVAAVGVMLLRDRGISMTQAGIIDIIGESSTVEQLAEMLGTFDRLSGQEYWFGGFVREGNLEKVATTGQFAAVFREGRPLGHMVLVRVVEEGYVYLSDPWEGTNYIMTVEEFYRVWSGEVVFKWKLST